MTSPRSSSSHLSLRPAATWGAPLPGGAELVCAGRPAGDFSDPSSPEARAAQGRLVEGEWTWLHQVHGGHVVVVDSPGGGRGQQADAAVSASPGVALAVMTADCAPIGLSSPEGVSGVVHAGWRGLLAGVVEAALAAMRSLGAGEISAALGPCIHPHAYQFSDDDIDVVAARFGPSARSLDDQGHPALDLPAVVRAALHGAGAALVADAATCTHCSADHWSWRARADRGRQASVLVAAGTAA